MAQSQLIKVEHLCYKPVEIIQGEGEDNVIEEESVLKHETETEIITEINAGDYVEQTKEHILNDYQIEVLYGAESEPCCKSSCNKKVPKDLALVHRRCFQDKTKRQQDLMILTHLQAHRRDPVLLYNSMREKYNTDDVPFQSRLDHSYYFSGIHICKTMYLFLHSVGKRRFANLVKHYDEAGISSRQHGNERKTPKRSNIFTAEDIEVVVQFLMSYSEQVGRRIVRRFPGKKGIVTTKLKLPSTSTKALLYKKFCEYLEENPISRKPGLSLFCKIWNRYTPYIVSGKKSKIPLPSDMLLHSIDNLDETDSS